jgi:hypothetical protein
MRPSKRWLAAMAALLVLAPPALLVVFAPQRRPAPLALYMPDRIGAVARLGDLEAAWQSHWKGRPVATPDGAMRDLMAAVGAWDRLVAKRGQAQAQARVRWLPQAIANAIGRESRLFFGEWGGAAPSQGQVGLALVLPRGAALEPVLDVLADLFLVHYQIGQERVGTTTIHVLKARHDRAGVAYCVVGGRLVVSLRQNGPGPLPLIARRVQEGHWSPPAQPVLAALSPESDLPTRADAVGRAGWVVAAMAPARLLDQTRQLSLQRGKKSSKKSRATLAQWDRRLAGIDRLMLRSGGPSITDMDLTANWAAGAAPAISRDAPAEAQAAKPAPGQGAAPAKPDGADAQPTPPMIELEGDGAAWAALVERAAFASAKSKSKAKAKADAIGLQLVAPGLEQALGDVSAKPASAGRLGVALYRSSAPAMARVLNWRDAPPVQVPAASQASEDPAIVWGRVASGQAPAAPGDLAAWLGPPLAVAPSPARAIAAPRRLSPIAPSEDAGWTAFAARQWQGDGVTPPAAFVAADFASLAAALNDVPSMFLKKKTRKKLESWQATTRGLALGMGGATLRLDAQPSTWTLQLRTLRLAPPARAATTSQGNTDSARELGELGTGIN